MDERKKEFKYKKEKEFMDKKRTEHYGEQKKEHMKGTKKSGRMMGFRGADECQESLGFKRVEPCHAHHYRGDRSQRYHAHHRSDRDQIKGFGIQHQERPHRQHDHSRRSTRSILHEKQHLERLVYALQRRLRKVSHQLNHRLEYRYGYEAADHHRGASRF